MDARITQDDVIYFIVTDRFFGANTKSVEPSDTTIYGGTLDGIIDIFWCNRAERGPSRDQRIL